MIIGAVIFFINLIVGAAFFRRYLFRDSFFPAAALFIAVYPLIIFTAMMIGIPLNVFTVNWPLVLLPWVVIRHPPAPWSGLGPRAKSRFTLLLFIAVAVLIIVAVVQIMKAPLFERDGLGIWLTKAKMIALDRNLSGANFFDPLRIHDKPRYPLMVPILEASFMVQTGISEWSVKLVFAYIWVVILGTLYEQLNRRAPSTALPAVILLSLIPAYYCLADGGLHTGYADIPISLFYLTAIVFLTEYRRAAGMRPLIGTGLAVAAAVFTKNEGYAFALAVFTALCLGRERPSKIALVMLSALVPLVPWLLTVFRLPTVHQEHYAAALPGLLSRLPSVLVIIKNTILELLDPRHWGLFWLSQPVILFIAKPTPELRSPLAILAATLILYLAVYLLTPWDIPFQMSVSLPRLLLHLAPAGVYLTAVAIGPAVERT